MQEDFGPVLEIEKSDHSGDNLVANCREDHFNITIDQPWAGDTETGFGNETSFSMKPEEAKRLADWIYAQPCIARLL